MADRRARDIARAEEGDSPAPPASAPDSCGSRSAAGRFGRHFLQPLAALVWSQLPVQLDVRTDIVGYPTAGDFNIERYFWAYGLVAGLFPFLTLALYLIARRTIAPGPAEPLGVIALFDRRAPAASGDRVTSRSAPEGSSSSGSFWASRSRSVEAGRTSAESSSPSPPPLTVSPSPLIAAVAVAGPLRDRELDTVLAGVNAVLATLTVLGLAWVSSGTKVTVSSDGTVHHYPWFPWWLGGLVTAAVLAIVLRALRGWVSAEARRAPSPSNARRPGAALSFRRSAPGRSRPTWTASTKASNSAPHTSPQLDGSRGAICSSSMDPGGRASALTEHSRLRRHTLGEPRRRGSAVETSRGGRALPTLRLPLPRQLALPRRHAGCDPDRLGVYVPGPEHPPPVRPRCDPAACGAPATADVAEGNRLHDCPASPGSADARGQLHGSRVPRGRPALRACASRGVLENDSLRGHDSRARRGLDRLPGLTACAGRFHLLLPHIRPGS